jgi:acetyl esterase/lipase
MPSKTASQQAAEARRPEDKPRQREKADPLGDAIEGTGKLLGEAGKVVLDGSGTVILGTGQAIGGTSAALGKVVEGLFAPKPEPINSERRVVYATAGDEKLMFDVFRPKRGGTFPMIVYLHGGAWYKKHQEGFFEPMCRWMAEHGYVVFNVSYRLAPKHKFPAQVNDALGAIIYAKTNAAKYNGDPARVAVMGDSAGGNLAGMAALAWDDPYFKPSFQGDGTVTAQTNANVFLFAVYDLVWMYNMFGLYVIVEDPKEIGQMYMGGTPDQMPERYRMGSPLQRVRKDMSPTLIVCGADDPLRPQSEAFHKKLNAMGVPNGLYISVGDTHGFTAFPLTKGALDCYNAVNAFLSVQLKHQRRLPTTPAPSAKPPEASKQAP